MSRQRQQRQDAVNEVKRGLILEAARRVFEAEGLEGASMRAIADAAGYTAAALYFHFESKEAIYGALLEQSLERLIADVEAAVAGCAAGGEEIETGSLAVFDFYAANPRELDLGFYLFHGGMKPKGLSRVLDRQLNSRLLESLLPVRRGLAALGVGAHEAQAMTASIFAHAVGLLTLLHTGRMRLFKADPRELMSAHVRQIVRTLAREVG